MAQFRCELLAVACVAVLVAAAGQVQGAIVHNSYGLTSPTQIITFNEHVFPDDTVITTQFSDLGVTFSPNLYYSPDSYEYDSFPHFTDPFYLGNFSPGYVDPYPYFIEFSQQQTGAAFSMVTNPGESMFTAYLGNTVVESFIATTSTGDTNNFYGFTGIVFDRIRVDVGGDNSAMILDNLQLEPNVNAVPEPCSVAIWGGLGAIAMAIGGARRRRREKQIA